MAITDGLKHATGNGGPETTAGGRALLRDPRLNRGTAFTYQEREALGVGGLVPAGVQTLEQQAKRAYEQYQAQPRVFTSKRSIA